MKRTRPLPLPVRSHPAYSRAVLQSLRAAAFTCVPGVTGVSHLTPRAYCVAKPAAHCAVFAVPPCDRDPLLRDESWVSVQNESAANVKFGDWWSLAYVVAPSCGQMRALFPATTPPSIPLS